MSKKNESKEKQRSLRENSKDEPTGGTINRCGGPQRGIPEVTTNKIRFLLINRL